MTRKPPTTLMLAVAMARKPKRFDQNVPAMKGFAALDKAALGGDSAIDMKTKELICVGIAIGARCQGCIAYHVRGAIRAGASKEEVNDAIGVAMFMGGGPSMIYAMEAHEALEQHWEAEKNQ